MTLSGRRVFDFNDPIEFLRSEFQAIKEVHPEFSVRQWAAKMGLDKPNLLVDVLKGKKPLRPRYIEFLKNGLSLDASEELYFLTLILKRKSKDTEDQAVYDRILSSLSPGPQIKTQILDDAEIFSDCSTLTILSALEIPALRKKDALHSKLSSRMPIEEIERILKHLDEKGLITLTEEGYVPSQQRLMTSTDKSNRGVHRYYAQVSDLAKEAISVDLLQREFQCFSVTIDSDDLPAFKEMIRTFRTKMASRALHTMNPDSVYQMNMQFFPLVAPTKEEDHQSPVRTFS